MGNWQGQNRQICILKFQAHIVGLLYAFFDAVPKDQARDCLIFVCGWFGDGLQVAQGVAILLPTIKVYRLPCTKALKAVKMWSNVASVTHIFVPNI